jgi:nanoRNase/pAp phosphatase (c-di-AMP/oligoRNAs hydrolase)
MSHRLQADVRSGAALKSRPKSAGARRSEPPAASLAGARVPMTSFVESCVEAVTGSAVALERRTHGRKYARKLLRVLANKKNILVTTHEHPDPDAFGAALAMCTLLKQQLPEATITASLKGRVGGGLNEVFYRETALKLAPWDDSKLGEFDAIVLLDTQPAFAYSPLPPDVHPTVVIDHHRSHRGRKPKSPFCDIRPDVGASTSIIFGYLMELDFVITPDLAAVMLYAIESDLAGAAGHPGDLDNIALSSLTLKAEPHKLYRMRYVDMPQSYYTAYAAGLNNAMFYDDALVTFLGPIDSLEKPAVIADFLLRFDQIHWAFVIGVHGTTDGARLVLSLRTDSPKTSAGDLLRRLLRGVGEGGGHRTKAGGVIRLSHGSAAEIERVRNLIRRRYLRALKVNQSRSQKLVPPAA